MKPTKETLLRTVVLAIALINQILTMLGKNPLPFAESDVYTFFTIVSTAAATMWTWWKNNSYTKNAIMADAFKDTLDGSDAIKKNSEVLPPIDLMVKNDEEA